MSLVEVAVRQLHQGVSRQPDHVRFPGQVQEASNCIFRVEEAGFSKRFGSQHIARVSDPPAGGNRLPFHVIDLDSTEKYGLTIDNGTVHIIDLLDGSTKTVTVNPASLSYITDTHYLDFVFVTILDYTLIANKATLVALTADTSSTGNFAGVYHIADGRTGNYTITIDGITSTYTTSATDATTWDTSHIASQLKTTMTTNLGVNYTVSQVAGSYLTVVKTGNASFTSEIGDPTGGLSIIATVSNGFQTSSDQLPAHAVDGMIVKIAPGVGTDVPAYYMQFHGSGTDSGYWDECVAPGITYKLDPATMPQQLVRNGDGTFTLGPATWGNRIAGDATSVPNPPFVGQSIYEMTFFRGRLGFLFNDQSYFSASEDFFNFWPKKSTLQLDSDPFGFAGSTNRPAKQRFAVPYRKILWTTSDNNQFEISAATLFSAKGAVNDLSTSYVCSAMCRPIPMAQMLYFASNNGGDAIVCEYTYNYLTLTAVAPEITKHVRGYLKGTFLGMAADQPTGNLFTWTSDDTSKMYVWTVFWDGMQRAQSCWASWSFPGAYIHGGIVVAGNLYLLMGRADGVHIEMVPLADGVTNFPIYAPRLDRMVQTTSGTYDTATNSTTFTLPYPAAGVTCVLPNGVTLPVTPSGDNATVSGFQTVAAFGFTYDSYVTLSKQYQRDQQGTAILNGKLSLTSFTVAHKDTGYYQVEVATPNRNTDIYPFTARLLSDAGNLVGDQPIVSGVFTRGMYADGVESAITIRNDTHLPFTISEIVFRGTFNELVRQG